MEIVLNGVKNKDEHSHWIRVGTSSLSIRFATVMLCLLCITQHSLLDGHRLSNTKKNSISQGLKLLFFLFNISIVAVEEVFSSLLRFSTFFSEHVLEF